MLRVDLVERSGGDGEFDAADCVVNVFFSPDDRCFVAEDDVCFFRVDVLDDRFDVRECRGDLFDDFRFVREVVCPCDEDDHHFACDGAVSDHDVSEPAFVAFFVVRFDAVFAADLFNRLNDAVVFRLLDQAFVHVDDLMAALLVEACDQAAFSFADRNLRFVSVVPRVFHAEGRVDGDPA